jgi:glutathione synthase/RimK-type ligase-like ATP-grasp enzyme
VVIGGKVVHAYWRLAPAHDYRTNVALGGSIDLSPVPQAALALAEKQPGCVAGMMWDWTSVIIKATFLYWRPI